MHCLLAQIIEKKKPVIQSSVNQRCTYHEIKVIQRILRSDVKFCLLLRLKITDPH